MSETHSITPHSRILRHESTIRRAVWVPLIALAILVVFLFSLAHYFYSTSRWVRHSGDVLFLASRSLRLATEMEAGRRGFFSGGNRLFLQGYDDAAASLTNERSMDKLVDLTADNPDQHARAKSFRNAFQTWRQHADDELTRRRTELPARFSPRPEDDIAVFQMERVRAVANDFIRHEMQLKEQRTQESDYVAQVALFGGMGLTLLMGGFLAHSTHNQMRVLSEQYETVLDGEARVRDRLATTLTAIGDGVMVTDADGRITLVNPVAEELTGWSNEEARGRDHREIFDIFQAETGEKAISPVDRAIKENHIVLLADPTLLTRRDGTQIAIEDSAAPVRDKVGNITGAVLVFRDVTDRRQQEAELTAALERNSRIAETLQRSLLTTPDQKSFPGFSVATVYEPAWDEAEVGGDFFDVFSFWEDKVAFIVGDATGKGLKAAATINQVKYALRAYLHDDPSPQNAVTRLNQFLHDTQTNTGATPFTFLSLAVVVVAIRTGEGVAACAGSEPPLLLRKDGTAQETSRPGMMLGASLESQYEGERFTMEPGDVLALTTDGITEARRYKREFFGYDGFTKSLQEAVSSADGNIETIAAHVIASTRSFVRGRLKDDVCLLVARRD